MITPNHIQAIQHMHAIHNHILSAYQAPTQRVGVCLHVDDIIYIARTSRPLQVQGLKRRLRSADEAFSYMHAENEDDSIKIDDSNTKNTRWRLKYCDESPMAA
jgi:hypothetical protein